MFESYQDRTIIFREIHTDAKYKIFTFNEDKCLGPIGLNVLNYESNKIGRQTLALV